MMLEYVVMFFTHLMKAAEYFILTEAPVISAELLPYAVEGMIYNVIKILGIYLSGFV